MNVEGLTRENVASHLQKYRLQLKKDHRLDDEGNLTEAQVRFTCLLQHAVPEYHSFVTFNTLASGC